MLPQNVHYAGRTLTSCPRPAIINRRCSLRNACSGQRRFVITMAMTGLKDQTSADKRKTRARPKGAPRLLARRPAAAGPKRVARYAVQSLMLGLRVIEALAASGKERGITELATQLKTSKWRIFRHLHSLCEEGY